MDGYVLSWEMLVTECVECHVGEAIGVPNNISGGGGRRAGGRPGHGPVPLCPGRVRPLQPDQSTCGAQSPAWTLHTLHDLP